MTEEDRFALLAEAEYFQLEGAVKVITETEAGANMDLHNLAQIVGKRIKVTQTYGHDHYRNKFAVQPTEVA